MEKVISSKQNKYTMKLNRTEGHLLDNAIAILAGSPMASADAQKIGNSLEELPDWDYMGKCPVTLHVTEPQAMLIHDAMYVIYEMHEYGSFDQHTGKIAQTIMDVKDQW